MLFGFFADAFQHAIVLKTYSDRLEVDAARTRRRRHLIISRPVYRADDVAGSDFGGREGASPANIATKLGTAVAAVAIIMFARAN